MAAHSLDSADLAPAWLEIPADPNDLAPGLWPANTTRAADGRLSLAGIPVDELAATYGSPLYVIDEADFRGRAARTRAAFDSETARIGTSAKVYYAAKAFLSADIARWVAEEGLYVDVCSGGELALALAAGIPAARLGLHGNNKSLAEIDRAVGAGIGAIVLDSLQEIDRVADAAARHGVVQNVRLRVNSGVHADTHDFLATSHEDQKFGITRADAPAAVAKIRARGELKFLGLHCHIGSQIFGSAGFGESAARMLELHRDLLAGGDIPELNLGGGFGIAYTRADDPAEIETLAADIADQVATEAVRLGIAVPVLAFEPGRYISGPTTMSLYEVGTTKDVSVALPEGGTAIRRYLSVDGGMSDNARPALYGAQYSARMTNRVSAAAPALSRVAGKHCESGDIVVYNEYLPADVVPGDRIAVPATGAYCWSLASNYNFLGRPAVVAVLNGESRLLVRGETETELLARDAGLDKK
ncbi:diaminopimelate decarboxylase [Mycetocola lacteus]|uniref:Diaminopimelate decarboxylase n=1 Tax=Mycetocola lacteus TaxID=76637 RepID=A0A3L7AS07_9MICO|nr:diaminopimelate decarboxylase [Mycetocola lacteus]RLP83293.1 diaminopimelate decarboxylase [Mycetocola lacteus]